MIISRTPFRISFFGGGTDYPVWFREHGGAVLASSFNRYCYLTCRFLPPFFEHRSRIVWSEIEQVDRPEEIRHPVVRAVLQHLGVVQGVEIHHNGDLPARSGLGSSSAFTVGLLHALHTLKGEPISKETLAREAIHVEQKLLRETVGVQDQIQTAFGGLNRIAIAADGAFTVEPVAIGNQRVALLERNLLLVYTGLVRHASTIAAAQIKEVPRKQSELHRMRAMVDEGLDILRHGDIDDFGRLLHESWMLKRSLSKVIAPAFVDEIYGAARRCGALGGKLLGAGGGGFMLLYVRPENHVRVLDVLSKLLLVPFAFETQGTRVIFNDPPQYSRTAYSHRDFKRFAEEPVLDDERPWWRA